jgi:hypothetical protein
MPLIQRPHSGWMAFQETLPGTVTGGPRTDLAAGWPNELPGPEQLSAVRAASLPRLPNQPGTLPVRGRPTPGQLGLSPGTAPTGEPAMGQGRSSIFMSPNY